MHRGYPTETLVRFLKARDGNVVKAHKMVRLCAVKVGNFPKLIAYRVIIGYEHFADGFNYNS